MAFKDPTAWASFAPLIGNMVVLATPSVRADGEIYPGQRGQQAALHRQHRARSAVSGARHRSCMSIICASSARRSCSACIRSWTTRPSGGRTSVPSSKRSSRIIRASRCRTGFRGRPSASIASTGPTGSSSIGLAPSRARAGCPTRNLLQPRARARFRPADQLGRRSRPPRARGRGGFERVSARPAYRRSLRRAERQAPWRPGRDIARRDGDSGTSGDRVRLRRRAQRRSRGARRASTSPPRSIVPPAPIFPRKKPSGRVDLVRRGNVVEASTEGVRAFTLLLSPSIFDFRRPDHGRAPTAARYSRAWLNRALATMLKWAARDNDRTMVFGAELNIELGNNLNKRSGDQELF